MSNFSVVLWWQQVTFNWDDDDDVSSILDKEV